MRRSDILAKHIFLIQMEYFGTCMILESQIKWVFEPVHLLTTIILSTQNSTAFLRSFPYKVVSSFLSCTLQLLSKIVPGGMGRGGRWDPPPLDGRLTASELG